MRWLKNHATKELIGQQQDKEKSKDMLKKLRMKKQQPKIYGTQPKQF